MVQLNGHCDVDKLEKAIQIIVRRHEALHLRFSPEGSYQEKCAPKPLAIPRLDLSDRNDVDRSNALAQIAKRIGSTPFDLVNGPIIRIELVKCTNKKHVMAVSCHHIVCDGWSWNVLLQEMGTVYGALCNGSAYRLDKAFQYSNYVMAELQRQTEDSVQRSYDYWLEQYADVPPALELPTDRPRPPIKAYEGGTVSYHFHDQVYQAIKQSAAEQKVSLFAYLFSAFQLMVARLSGQNDVVLTVPAAGQLNVGKKTLVGYCVNLLPVRAKLDLDQTFAQAIKAARSTILDAYDHQNSTYSGIVHRMNLPQDLSRLPLSEINFNMDRDDAGVKFGVLEVEVHQTAKEAVFSDIFFNINEHRDGLKVDCDFNHALFDHTTIERWIHSFEYILAQIAANPDQPLKELSLVTPHEHTLMMHDWNDTAADYPRDKALHQLFEEQAARTPEAVAIHDESVDGEPVSFTYGELNQRANQLAHYLIRVGAKPNELIGLCVERSIDMMAGLLGILKSGAGYVPMDPMFPEVRLQGMAEDAAPITIITESTLSSIFANSDVPLLLLDQDRAAIAAEANTNPDVAMQPSDLAYVIYTSGSTGKPKGVQLPHQGVVNFLCSMAEEPGLSADDTILAVTTISFDIAVLELFLPLMVGAKVIIASQEMSMDADWLIQTLPEATVMQATPATWQMLLSAGWIGKQAGLRILVGGEALSRELADQLLQRCDELWNMYGPTETTIWSSVQRVEENLAEASTHLGSIGRPITNTQLHIRNETMQPVPVGVVGDLYIGGDGLAHGYRNQPELTAEKFIPNPFGDGKIYLTGDLARYQADGTIDFLGRSDFQVKIRGFRIEMGEIEAVLEQHPNVRQAAVTAWEGSASSQMLAGYVIGDGMDLSTAQLREYLRDRLPQYMVPSSIMVVDALPLTPNGKVDRQALPRPEEPRPDLEETYVAPQTPTEEEIAQIWQTILEIDRVGTRDNFFDLGGHSLQATRVIARLRNIYQIEFNLRTFFNNPTIQSMAHYIMESMVADEADADLLDLISEVQGMSEDEIKSLLDE